MGSPPRPHAVCSPQQLRPDQLHFCVGFQTWPPVEKFRLLLQSLHSSLSFWRNLQQGIPLAPHIMLEAPGWPLQLVMRSRRSPRKFCGREVKLWTHAQLHICTEATRETMSTPHGCANICFKKCLRLPDEIPRTQLYYVLIKRCNF